MRILPFFLCIFFISIVHAGELRVMSMGTNTKDDPVQKILDNIGAKSWHPDESPEKLARMIEGNNYKTPQRRPIETCISMSEIKIKPNPDGLSIATQITNKCPLMVSYFIKTQIQNEDGFPISKEVQNGHTQIPANQTKTDLLVFKKKDLVDLANDGYAYVQLISHDHHAYGAISKKQKTSLTNVDVDAYTKKLVEGCLDDFKLRAQIFNEDISKENMDVFHGRLSYIVSATNKCGERIRLSGVAKMIDKDGFDRKGRVMQASIKIKPYETISQTNSKAFNFKEIDKMEELDVLLEFSINGSVIASKIIPLSDISK